MVLGWYLRGIGVVFVYLYDKYLGGICVFGGICMVFGWYLCI